MLLMAIRTKACFFRKMFALFAFWSLTESTNLSVEDLCSYQLAKKKKCQMLEKSGERSWPPVNKHNNPKSDPFFQQEINTSIVTLYLHVWYIFEPAMFVYLRVSTFFLSTFPEDSTKFNLIGEQGLWNHSHRKNRIYHSSLTWEDNIYIYITYRYVYIEIQFMNSYFMKYDLCFKNKKSHPHRWQLSPAQNPQVATIPWHLHCPPENCHFDPQHEENSPNQIQGKNLWPAIFLPETNST